MVLGPFGGNDSDDTSRAPIEIGPESYDAWRRTTLGSITQARELQIVFDLAGPLESRRLLDVGCGDGIYLVEAARRGAQVSGVDISEAMLEAARTRAADAGVPIHLLSGDVQALPFEDESFDIVIAITVLCFVPDPQRAVNEMARVLTPGGRLVIGELGRWNTWAAWRKLRGWLGSETWRRATFRTARQLTGLVHHAGLKRGETRGAVYYPPITLAARSFARFERRVERVTTLGAAFITLAAVKPSR